MSETDDGKPVEPRAADPRPAQRRPRPPAVKPPQAAVAQPQPRRAAYTQYKVIGVSANGFVAVMSGRSGLALKKLERRLNREVAEGGWQVVSMVVERQRFLLFWQREAMVVTLGR